MVSWGLWLSMTRSCSAVMEGGEMKTPSTSRRSFMPRFMAVDFIGPPAGPTRMTYKFG